MPTTPSTLETFRRSRRLGWAALAVLCVFWLMASLAGVRTTQLPGQAAFLAMQSDICTTARTAPAIQLSALSLADAVAADDFSYSSQHAPGCLLCLALSPPQQLAVQVYRPPAPAATLSWPISAHFPVTWQAAAALPPRGPPANLHV